MIKLIVAYKSGKMQQKLKIRVILTPEAGSLRNERDNLSCL